MEEKGRRRSLQSTGARGNHADQDTDEEDDLQDAQLWHHRRLQRQVGFIGIGGSFPGDLSPQPSSSGCEQRVSPLDPNLSSAACYSPQPPYSSPMGALNRPDSPIEVLAHSRSLVTIQANSNISSVGESIETLPRPQARWPHEAAISYVEDEDVRNEEDDNNENDNEDDIDVGVSEQVRGWNKIQHVQTSQHNTGPHPRRYSGPVSPRPGPSGIQPQRPVVIDCDSDTEEDQHQRGFMAVNPHLVNSNFNQINNSEEAEALEAFGSDCEASSSDRDHMSPLGSPRTPGDNCVVSSSTGQIDSVPPTPVEFQGNDASAPPSPSSPRSPPRMVGVAILDSTVDSSSGRGLEAPERERFGENGENEEIMAPVGRSINLPPHLHRTEDEAEAAAAVVNSPPVELLVNPQDMILRNNQMNDSRFRDQLSFSLNSFSNISDRYDSRPEETQNKLSSGTSGSQPYLLIPRSKRSTLPGGHLHSASVSVSKSSVKRISDLDQPSTSNTNSRSNAAIDNSGNRQLGPEINSESIPYRRSVTVSRKKRSENPEIPIEVSLESRGQIKDEFNMINGSISTSSSMQSKNIFGSFGNGQYVLDLTDNSLNSSLSSRNGFSNGREVENLAEESNNFVKHKSKGNYNIIRGDPNHTPKIPMVNHPLNLNSISAADMQINLNKVPDGSVSPANDNTEARSSPPAHIMQNTLNPVKDAVSLLVGNNENSNDGTLLMMVSSNGHSLNSALSLEDSIDVDVENSLESSNMEDSNPEVPDLANEEPIPRLPHAHSLFNSAPPGTLETRNSLNVLHYTEPYPHFFPSSSSLQYSSPVSRRENDNFPFLATKTSKHTPVSNSNSNPDSIQNHSDNVIPKVASHNHNIHSLFSGSQSTSIRPLSGSQTTSIQPLTKSLDGRNSLFSGSQSTSIRPLTKSLDGRGVKGSSHIRSNVIYNDINHSSNSSNYNEINHSSNSSNSNNAVLVNDSESLSKDYSERNSINGIISNNNSNIEYISICDNISKNEKNLISTQDNHHTPITSQQDSFKPNGIVSSNKSNSVFQNRNISTNNDNQMVSGCLPSVSINPSIISNSLFANSLDNDVISSSQASNILTNNIVDINAAAPTTQNSSFSILQPVSSSISSSSSSSLPHMSLSSGNRTGSTTTPSINVTDNSPFLSGSPVVLSSIHNPSLEISLDQQQEPEANILKASRADLEEQKESFDVKKDFDDPLKLSTSENVQDDFIVPDFWCGECGQSYAYECHQHRVLTISDKPVMTRAWASLPAAHLCIKVIPEQNCSGVFSRKLIPQRTQFGPLEGVMSQDSTGNLFQGLVYTLDSGDHFLHIDTTDESFCNWMKFVRPASSYLEQNCIVSQQGKGLYFLTTSKIPPRTELRVGYSKVYADRRNLQTLKPTDDELQFLESQRKTWSCFECDESFESSAQLQQHLNNHDEKIEEDKRKKRRYKSRRVRGTEDGEDQIRRGTKKLKVEPQSFSSTSQEDIENNKQEISDSPVIFKCKMCGIHFNSYELDHIHSLGHEEERGEENGECNNNMQNLKHEKLQMSQENKNYTECPECNKEFGSTSDLINHVNEHGFYSHSSKAHKCNYCYKSFSRQERLEAHMSVHGNEAEKPYSCSYCLRRFCNNSALACHIKVHTEGRKAYDCPICHDMFSSVSHLKSHVKMHCINGEYLCPTCHKKFPSYHKIRRHIRSYHAVTPVTCTICGKDLPSHDKLKIHMLSHSDRRDFVCPDCGKSFKRKDKLREHSKRMHSAESLSKAEKNNNKGPPKFTPKVDPSDYKLFLYKCHSCLVGFKRRGMLVNHLAKRHPQIIPSSVPELNQPILKATRCYYCQYCEKVYRSSSKRKLHIIKNHPGAELPPAAKRESEADNGDDPSFSQTMGATPVYAHSCQWCHRQYASKARLLRHHRQSHPDLFNEEVAAAGGGIEYSADGAEGHGPGEMGMLLDGQQQTLAGELALEGSLIRGHHRGGLVSIAGHDGSRTDSSSDLLTQAMGEISSLGPSAHGEQQYVRLVSSGSIVTTSGASSTNGSQSAMVVSGSSSDDVGVSCSGGTTTLSLVTADGADHTVTISLPPGQYISLIPGLTVANGTTTTTQTSSGSIHRSIPSTSSSGNNVISLDDSAALASEQPCISSSSSSSSNRSNHTVHGPGEMSGVGSFMNPSIAQPVSQQEADAQEQMVGQDSHTLTTLTNSQHTF